jgi:hypothetical protein
MRVKEGRTNDRRSSPGRIPHSHRAPERRLRPPAPQPVPAALPRDIVVLPEAGAQLPHRDRRRAPPRRRQCSARRRRIFPSSLVLHLPQGHRRAELCPMPGPPEAQPLRRWRAARAVALSEPPEGPGCCCCCTAPGAPLAPGRGRSGSSVATGSAPPGIAADGGRECWRGGQRSW